MAQQLQTMQQMQVFLGFSRGGASRFPIVIIHPQFSGFLGFLRRVDLAPPQRRRAACELTEAHGGDARPAAFVRNGENAEKKWKPQID